MRVTFASTLEFGGPVSHMRHLVPYVADAGVDVTVLCQTEAVADDFRESGIRTYVVPLRSGGDVRGTLALPSHLARADVVHTHDRRAGLFGRMIAYAVGARVVHTIHGLPEEIANRVGTTATDNLLGASALRLGWITHGYLRIESLLARLGRVVTPSRAMARFLVERGMPRGRISVIPSGVSVRRERGSPLRRPARVGTAANLEPWKGIDTLIEACARVPVPLRLEIWGDGSSRRELERLAASRGVDAVFHGRVGDASGMMTELDVFALPSRAENLPISLLEAMAAAVPVVATRVGGIPEIVTADDTGLLVEPDDPVGLAAAIGRLVADEDCRLKVAAAGARAVAERFEARSVAARLVDLYEAVCGSSR
jgi:glycosyltransferase involved in cell wall biosynthesis